MHIVLETPRLFLRRFTASEEDAALLLQLNSDPEVLQYLHEPLLHDLEHAHQVLTNVLLPQYELNLGRWAMHLKEDGRFLGWCGLKWLADREEVDLGYRLQKQFWGRGYATEAAGASIEHGFEMLSLHRIVGRAHVHNAASANVLKKVGMKYLRDEIMNDNPVQTFEAINHSPINPF